MTVGTHTPSPINDLLQHQEAADWVRAMIAYHSRTGAYRPQDLRRLLGDPTKGVAVGPGTSIAEMFPPREQP